MRIDKKVFLNLKPRTLYLSCGIQLLNSASEFTAAGFQIGTRIWQCLQPNGDGTLFSAGSRGKGAIQLAGFATGSVIFLHSEFSRQVLVDSLDGRIPVF